MSTPTITIFVLGEFQTNCFVVTTPGSPDCWIVDCGMEPGPLLDHVEREALHPVALLLTHTHVDHIAGIDEAISRFAPLPVFVHEAEKGFCSDPMLNLSAMGGMSVAVTEPEHHLHDGDELDLNGSTWRVLHTPGHSPGGVCFVHDESNQAIVGDTLFAGSMGRIDFPTANPDDMRRSLHDVLMKLPDEMTIHPGHGPSTTIGRERATNPFLLHGF